MTKHNNFQQKLKIKKETEKMEENVTTKATKKVTKRDIIIGVGFFVVGLGTGIVLHKFLGGSAVTGVTSAMTETAIGTGAEVVLDAATAVV